MSADLVILNEDVVDNIAPEVGEHEGAGVQEVEYGDLDLTNGEGEADDVHAESDM